MGVKGLVLALLLGWLCFSMARHTDDEQFKVDLETYFGHKDKNSRELDSDEEGSSSGTRHHSSHHQPQETLKLKRRKLFKSFECRKKDQGCGGVVPCCGDLKCFWSGGYSLLTEGKCVECVGKGHKCQLNGQCCGDLACLKGGALSLNGLCHDKREKGGSCYDNYECRSHNCVRSGWKKASFQEGSCA